MGHCYSLGHHSHSHDHAHAHGAGSCSTAQHDPNDLTKIDMSKIYLEYQGEGYASGDTANSKMKDCEKYKDHSEMYRTLESFSENDMPAGFKDGFKLIKVVSNQTCFIEVNCVSGNRPANYPSSEDRGQKKARAGSGCIHINNINLEDVTEWYYSTFSPATADSNKKNVYGTFNIQTAKHVIFDKEEMKSSTLSFFYDSEDKSQVVKATPVEIVGSDLKDDRIDIKCVTFDSDFGRRMKEVECERNKLWAEFTSSSRPKRQEHENDFVAVCISHIHASFKRISIGKAKQSEDSEREDGRTKWSCFTYDTPTCRGSSGAPVWICKQDGSVYSMVPHSYHMQEKSRSHSALGAVHDRNRVT